SAAKPQWLNKSAPNPASPTKSTESAPSASSHSDKPIASAPAAASTPEPTTPSASSPDPATISAPIDLRANQQSTPRNRFTELVSEQHLSFWFLFTAALIAVGLGALHALEPG